jgi:hypothetical protein
MWKHPVILQCIPMMNPFAPLLCLLLVLTDSGKSEKAMELSETTRVTEPTQKTPSAEGKSAAEAAAKIDPQLPPPGPKINACSLTTKEEVAAIQSAPITAAHSNEVPSGEFVLSQCYYPSSAPNMSVTVGVIQMDPQRPSRTAVSAYWHQVFERFTGNKATAKEEEEEKPQKGEKKRNVSREGEEKERSVHPDKINGIGDEAYWAGTRFGGTLYVLKGEKMLRISVGGPGDQNSKLVKSKALAEKALGRL